MIETPDGLPYIGENTERQFIATGYCGNGMTFGTLAAVMACEASMGRESPWDDLFHVRRKPLKGLWVYLRENLDFPYRLVRDRLSRRRGKSPAELRPGEAGVLKIDGENVAAYRDQDGKLVMRSAVCTHLVCLVGWNQADRTWDCPCHGSRFKPTGEVLAGPAESPLGEARATTSAR